MKKRLLFTGVSAIALTIGTDASPYDLTDKDIGQSANVTWTEVTTASGNNVIKVQLPDGDKFFEYKYNMPADYTKSEKRVGENLATTDVSKKTFENISGTTTAVQGSNHYQGGAVIANLNNDLSAIKIDSDFINNYINQSSGYTFVYGGAIMNYAGANNAIATIGNIISNFIGNYVETSDSSWGGAIINHADGKNTKAIIGNITGEFINNHVKSPLYVGGGAIAQFGDGNPVVIGDVVGDFIGNSLESTNDGGMGGAISNFGNVSMGNITGDFISNHLSGYDSVGGGAIKHQGQLKTINGSFIGNSAYSKTNFVEGGAIDNNGNILGIVGDFIGNNAQTDSRHGEGGAIHNNYGTIGDIKGSFIGNYLTTSGYAEGGAIHNALAKLGNLVGDFIGNHVDAESNLAAGGAIVNWDYDFNVDSIIKDITGNFKNNYAKVSDGYASGGAIYNYSDSAYGDGTAIIGKIKGDFTGNRTIASSYASGGAIDNRALDNASTTLGDISGDFIENYAQSSSYGYGGAISNYAQSNATATIKSISGNFEGNFVKTTRNHAQGGAIFNNSVIGNIINSSFIDNYVSGRSNQDSKTTGGAIYSTKDITIIAQNGGKSEFTGNYVIDKGVKTENAIYMASASSTLNLNAITNGQILFNDEIDGVEGYKIAIDGDASGTTTFNNHIRNADITLSNTNMIVDKAEYLGHNDNLTINSGNLTINSGEMTIKQLGLNTLNFKSLSIPSGLLRVDSVSVDLENKTSGMITTDNVSSGDGKIKVENILLTSDGDIGSTPVLFVSNNISDEVTTEVTEALAPIYKYGVAYDNESGEFIFTRGDKIVSPSVPATPIVRPSGYKAFNPGVFESDVFAMSSLNMQNAVVKEALNQAPQVFDYSKARVWATPYYSDDTLSYSGFYDVDSRNYGLIAGVDSKAYELGKNWTSVYTLFGAYNDGEDKYQGVKVDSKSWLVGLKASVYNGGFYGDAIIDYASHDMRSWTAFGKDRNDTYGYGAALKAGYKHEFDNRLSLDTSAMLSWQTIEGDDFTSKSGARISTDDYSRLTLTPQVKLGYSFEKVRPYALVRYNFVLDEDGSSTVNNIALPTIESKDYVEYGLGLETTDAFPHSGYAHVLRHDSGREGWSVTAGYKYNF